MKGKPCKTKVIVVSRSRTVLQVLPVLTLDRVSSEMVGELMILGVLFDQKLSFGAQVKSVAASASRSLGIMRKAYRVFRNNALVVGSLFLESHPSSS